MTTKKIKNILITNIVVLNGGDGAILFGMIKILKKAFGEESNILVYATSPEVANQMYPEIEFRETLGIAATRTPFGHIRYLGRICRTLQQARYLTAAWGVANGLPIFANILPKPQRDYLCEYASSDLVVSSGGTYLKEEYGVLTQACDYKLTLLLNRPLSFFTQSLGPFIRPDTRTLMKSIFSQASSIMLRDERSRNNILDLGLPNAPIHLAADAAFSLADPEVIKTAKQTRTKSLSALKVVISVRHWHHFSTHTTEEGMDNYRKSIAKLVNVLVNQGVEVTFLSTCQGIAEYDDDANEAEKVVQFLDADIAEKVTVIHEYIRFEELMVRIRNYDLCIGTRMHMCILSLISGIPVLPISYEFKTTELFTGLGLGEWVTDIETISPEEFPRLVQAFQVALPGLREGLFDKVLALHYSSLDAGIKIREALEHN